MIRENYIKIRDNIFNNDMITNTLYLEYKTIILEINKIKDLAKMIIMKMFNYTKII